MKNKYALFYFIHTRIGFLSNTLMHHLILFSKILYMLILPRAAVKIDKSDNIALFPYTFLISFHLGMRNDRFLEWP